MCFFIIYLQTNPSLLSYRVGYFGIAMSSKGTLNRSNPVQTVFSVTEFGVYVRGCTEITKLDVDIATFFSLSTFG